MLRARPGLGALAALPLLAACSSAGVASRSEAPAAGPAASASAARAPAAVLPPEASPVTFDMMAVHPEPGWNVPRAIAFSPGGAKVTYLQAEERGAPMSLFAFDVKTRETRVWLRASDLLGASAGAKLSREEELRLERQRQKASGITGYAFADAAELLVVPLGGDVFVRRGEAPPERLTRTPEPELDPRPCPKGESVAFVRGGELFAVDVASGRETQLTRGASPDVTRGLSDFNAQEEFGEPHGFFWSPGCDRIAYLEVDEREVAEYPVLGYREGKPDLMMQRYPLAGAKNPAVRLFLVDVRTRKSRPVAIPAPGHYLGRFHFSEDGGTLYLEALSRDQKRLSLLAVDARTGEARELAAETSETWLDFGELLPLPGGRELAITRARGGHRHADILDARTGATLRQLTQGAWDVEELEGAGDEGLYFTGTVDGPLERHLYVVPLEGGAARRAYPSEPGVHAPTVSIEAGLVADVHSSAERPPRAVLRELRSGAPAGELRTFPLEVSAGILRPPRFVAVRGPGGETLYGALLPPRRIEPGKKHPVVVMVYGGPGVQTVLDDWSPNLLWQHLADRGFVVFQLDNRGSAGRGPAFEAPIAGRLGEAELADQVAGVEYLRTLPYVDGDRVGIYGHSYGGFLAALALFKAPSHFQAGVSGSPVTSWRLYDTGYTERYMGTPDANATGYEASELPRLAKNLRGDLFVLHALMDENVHFDNTAILVDALVAADKDFDLMVFPGERHGYRSPAARKYALRRVVGFLAEHLGR